MKLTPSTIVLIEELISDKKQNFETKRKALNTILGKINQTFSLNKLLKSDLGEDKFLIAGIFMRLSTYSDLLWNWDDLADRIKLFKLFDEMYYDNWYKEIKIDINLDNHIKLEKFKNIENIILDRLAGLKTITSLDLFIKFRKPILQFLNQKSNRIIIDQFIIEKSILDHTRINFIFSKVEEYLNESHRKFEVYKDFTDYVSKYINELSNEKTIFIKNYFLPLFENILKIITSDFENSNIIKSSELKIVSSSRKYPFHLKGKIIEVIFFIENLGPGYAFNATINLQSDNLKILNPEIVLGTVKPGINEITFQVQSESDIEIFAECLILATWNDYNNQSKIISEIIGLFPQITSIDWDSIKYKSPYSLEAIKDSIKLIGRSEQIELLLSKFYSEETESVIINGQKRVGKTSIANVIKDKLQETDNFIVISTKTGDLNKNSPEKCLRTLGKVICDGLLENLSISKSIKSPTFDDSIEALIPFIKQLHPSFKEKKLIVIIDEFDEMPLELIRDKFAIGNTFLQNIRSLSEESYMGFLLIGAENIQYVKEETQRLNKFNSLRVDYFNKNKYWNDYQDLIRKPVLEYSLEFSDESIEYLFEITDGNPFFTKMICKQIFSDAIKEKNSFISKNEVEISLNTVLGNLDIIHLNHFWLDGIRFEDKTRKDEIETQRRKFLVLFANHKRQSSKVTRQTLKTFYDNSNLQINFDKILESFENRNILVEEHEGLRLKPRLFETWLLEKGSKFIYTGFSDEDAVKLLQEEQDKLLVKKHEIFAMIDRWPVYRGSKTKTENVNSWLSQFETLKERRIMFDLISHITFFSEEQVREKVKIIHKNVTNITKQFFSGKEQVSRNYLLSSFNLVDSTTSYAKLYAKENKIISDNICDYGSIEKRINKSERISYLIFVDDIIASGKTQIEYLEKLNRDYGNLLNSKKIEVISTAIIGHDKSIIDILNVTRQFPFDVKLFVADEISDKNKCFSENSYVSKDKKIDINLAKEIAKKYGYKLEKNYPLGFDNMELLIVFFDNCPNNTLPIIWDKNVKDPYWIPLFERIK